MANNETEADTRANRIDPVLAKAGWGVIEHSRIQREVICPGRILPGGKRGKSLAADYVLIYRGHKLAVIEAKRAGLSDTIGLAQAKDYANRLNAPFAYATNGIGWYEVDRQSGKEGKVQPFPTPEQLWKRCFGKAYCWRERFGEIAFETAGGRWELRYYQHNAVNAVLEAVAKGDKRILLTLATGTGKTSIAFQLAWKLFHAHWNISGKPTHRPRILFLADRNILADQAYNSFAAFPADALTRIDPETLKRAKGRVPKNAAIFFTIFQTFMTGEGQPRYQSYPPDFFDFIVIDECHRGGANDEGNWRGILEYFKPAVQLGLTATPRRKLNADTYAYFGDPVYVYSLREGIEDGFLTPFKVRQMASTLDEYVWDGKDEVLSGTVEEDRVYTEADFNTRIIIEERERSRVAEFMAQIDQQQKTLVFCATQEHALRVRDYINQIKISKNPDYCHRVTADDGALGEQHLRDFQDNEKSIPTILTTSQKLSTGVDARNVRNIVLMRPVNSMIEFKQIIGRGTRTYDGKDYFTLYDFVKAYENFNDPEWDGEPVLPEKTKPRPNSEKDTQPGDLSEDSDEDEKAPKSVLVIQLADGRAASIQYLAATTYCGPDGKPMSAQQFLEQIFGDLSKLISDEDELRHKWSDPESREHLINELEERGYDAEKLADMRRLIDAPDSDLFDVLAYIRFTTPPKTRVVRAETVRTDGLISVDAEMRNFLLGVLRAYEVSGETELGLGKLSDFLTASYGTLADAKSALGNINIIRDTFFSMQRELYRH